MGRGTFLLRLRKVQRLGGRERRLVCPFERSPGVVDGAAYTASSGSVQNMSVDHGGAHVGVPQELLDGADVVPVLEQVLANEWRRV